MIKPVTILTGFLGSGKTTYLNHLLKENKNIRYAIIENEFGEQGVDNELIMHADDTIVEMNNGCLCCTLNDNLYDILNELHDRRDQFDEVIIEATGVADPSGLAQPFIIHPLIKQHFPLVATICLVDAELIEDQLLDTVEASQQIINSDIILINKIDLVNPEYVKSLEQRITQLNPLAKIYKGLKNAYPTITYRRGLDESEAALFESDGLDATFHVEKPHHHHHHHEHTKNINSHSFVFERPFVLDVLYQQLFLHLTFHSIDLYRLKGIFSIEGEDEQVILQSSGKRLVADKKRMWNPGEVRKSVVVFIGKQLQREDLLKLLERSLSKSNE